MNKILLIKVCLSFVLFTMSIALTINIAYNNEEEYFVPTIIINILSFINFVYDLIILVEQF